MELVEVDDEVGCVRGGKPRQRLRLACAKEDVIAVDVDAVGAGAHEILGAIRVEARDDDDVERLGECRKTSLGQQGDQRQHGLAAARLIAVLLADQEHAGTSRRAGALEANGRNVAALLRCADDHDLDCARPRGNCLEKRAHLGVGGEVALARREGWRREGLGRIGEALRDPGALAVDFLRLEPRGERQRGSEKDRCGKQQPHQAASQTYEVRARHRPCPSSPCGQTPD